MGKAKQPLMRREAPHSATQRYSPICANRTPTNDIWIAASTMQHGLKLITTDKHYLKLPQIIVECCSI
jgi:predicted nucleic acid-binding protein